MKKIIITTITILFLCIASVSVYANSTQESISAIQEKIVEDSGKQVQKEVLNFVDIAKDYYEECKSVITKEVEIDKPYILYNYVDSNYQKIYEYPISYNGKVIFIIDAINVDNEWNLSVSQDNIDFLNSIDYTNKSEDFIFFTDGSHLYAQSSYTTASSDGSINKWNNSLNDKISTITNYVEDLESVDANIDCSATETYSREFSFNSDDHKRLKLYKQKGQGNYGMCWAASCATIINYIKGSNVTAKNVCNEMGIGYDDGADIFDKQEALRRYGVNYTGIKNGAMKWTGLKKRINKKYPIAMSTFGKQGGHALTLYGYQVISSHKYIIIWDSALGKNGCGITRLVAYNGDKTTVLVNGEAYLWGKSLYWEAKK